MVHENEMKPKLASQESMNQIESNQMLILNKRSSKEMAISRLS
jgi:hypothetical protein